MLNRFKLSLIVLICTSMGLMAQVKSVAVNELTGSELTGGEISTISNRLRSELFKTGSFAVMERGDMDAILKEQGFQQSGACDESTCMVELGRLLGVQEIIAGSVGKIGSNFFTISLRIVDVSTGMILKTADYDYTGQLSELITGGLKKAAIILTGKTSIDSSVQQQVLIPAADSTVQSKPIATKISTLQSVAISSTPSEASFTLDTLKGITPYTGKIIPGSYTISLQKNGFKPVSQMITVSDSTPFSGQFTLFPLPVNEKKPAKKGRVVRIASAIIGSGAIGAGIYFNQKFDKYDERAVSIHSSAQAVSADDPTAASLKTSYVNALDKRSAAKQNRTISYSISAAACTLFGISFAFGGSK